MQSLVEYWMWDADMYFNYYYDVLGHYSQKPTLVIIAYTTPFFWNILYLATVSSPNEKIRPSMALSKNQNL